MHSHYQRLSVLPLLFVASALTFFFFLSFHFSHVPTFSLALSDCVWENETRGVISVSCRRFKITPLHCLFPPGSWQGGGAFSYNVSLPHISVEWKKGGVGGGGGIILAQLFSVQTVHPHLQNLNVKAYGMTCCYLCFPDHLLIHHRKKCRVLEKYVNATRLTKNTSVTSIIIILCMSQYGLTKWGSWLNPREQLIHSPAQQHTAIAVFIILPSSRLAATLRRHRFKTAYRHFRG